MRVIAGIAKGLRLNLPKTNKVRPAADKVKGAVFNILGEIEGLRALDLFAGSGSVGIEALSRGASECFFVEADRKIAASIQNNLNHCGLQRPGRVLCMNVPAALGLLSRKKHVFDLIFVDPPYDKGWVNRTLNLLGNSLLLAENAQVIVEHSPRERPTPKETLEIFDSRKYGQTLISFLKRNQP